MISSTYSCDLQVAMLAVPSAVCQMTTHTLCPGLDGSSAGECIVLLSCAVALLRIVVD